MSTDISKLRPELLTKSLAELNRLKSEIDLAIIEKEKADAEAARIAVLDKAREAYEPLLDTIKLYHEHGFLSSRAVDFFTDKAGSFAPHKAIKKPRA